LVDALRQSEEHEIGVANREPHHDQTLDDGTMAYDTAWSGYLSTKVKLALVEARSDLLDKPDFRVVATLDDETLQQGLVEHHIAFMETAQSREVELLEAKASFAVRLHEAIDHQGLPLMHEQLDERLANVAIGFSDSFGARSRDRGTYNPITHSVKIDSNETGEFLKQTVFHELMHAVSGSRYVKSDAKLGNMDHRRGGLGQPGKDRLWLDEAITDLLANIMLDKKGRNFNLGSDKRTLNFGSRRQDMHSVLRRLPGNEILTYYDYKSAAIDVLYEVPSKTLLRAYFAQNDDLFEADQRAGTHAERDFQRALKIAGGKGRIADMSKINKLFQPHDTKTDDEGADDSKVALKIANKARRADWSDLGKIKRVINRRRVTGHTKAYQAQIERAKNSIAS